MSEQDQNPASGQEQTQREERPQQQGERERGGGSGGGGGRHGGRGRRHQPQQHRQQQQQNTRSGSPEASLNMRELRELVELFTSNGLTDLEFENEDIRVRLSKNTAPPAAAQSSQVPHAPSTSATNSFAAPSPAERGGGQSPSSSGAPASGSQASEEAARSEEQGEELHVITSPIVGTFYRAASPTSEAFVRAGSHVETDTTVCIIEAMKLMNEIQAEVVGTVEKIYVENGQPVEFGQPLFGIKK